MTHNFCASNLEQTKNCGLEYRYSIENPGLAPLVFMVHGRAGNYNVMSTFKQVLPEHWNVVLPQAPISDALGGYSWWSVSGAHAQVTPEVEQSAQLFEDFVEKILAQHDLNPGFLVGIGFSQGGALLSVFTQKTRLEIRGLALLASFVVDVASNKSSDLSALKVLFLHGSKDQVVALDFAQASLASIEQRGAQVERLVEPVAHKVGSEGIKALKNWLSELG